MNLMSRGFRGISSKPAQPSVAVFHDPLDIRFRAFGLFSDFRGWLPQMGKMEFVVAGEG